MKKDQSGDPSAGAPYGPVVPDTQGNLYGSASGGQDGDEVAYEITGEQLTILHSFGPELSAWGLALDKSGNLHGVSPNSGSKKYGGSLQTIGKQLSHQTRSRCLNMIVVETRRLHE